MPLLIHTVAAWLVGLFAAALAYQDASLSAWWRALVTAVAIGSAVAFVIALATANGSPTSRDPPHHELKGTSAHRGGRTPLVLAALGATLLASLIIGQESARTRNACVRTMQRDGEWRISLNDRAYPGARATGETVGSGAHASCRVPVAIHVKNGRAPPGAIVTAIGTARRTQHGLLVDGSIAPTGMSETLRAWRGQTGETIDTLFGRNAPIVRALLIADQDGIATDVRDRFADAGLVHMLSISGLHVAIIAGSLLTITSACRLSKRWSTAVALLTVVTYVATLGFPAPAVRSAVMLATVAITELWQRPVHPWTALALGAAIPTVQPAVVLDLGWQLSVGGMAALVAARAILRRLRTVDLASFRRSNTRAAVTWFRALSGWRAIIAREMLTGVIATIVTAPLIAWTFGRVSVVAPLSNLAAGPIVAVLQPALFLAVVLTRWRWAAQLVADASSVPIAMLDGVARWSASVPYAVIHIAPTFAGAWCAGIASGSFVRATASRRWTPWLLVAATALTIGVWSPTCTGGSGLFELHLLDVGQGDAIAMRTPHGQWVLVDAGRRWDGGDAGQRVVVPYIQRQGGPVVAFFLSHAHDDHVGGAASVLRALHPARWWEPAYVTASSAYRSSLAELQRQHIPWQRVHPGDSLRLDGVRFEILAPDSAWTAAQHDANETSVILRVQYQETVFLLTGDAEANEEAWLLEHSPPERLRANVLKLGHHGSRTSSTAAFLDAVQPSLGIVSVGEGNRYGHPAPEILGAFAKRGIPVLRTDRDGAIIVSTDGHRISVRSRNDRWTLLPQTGTETSR